MRKLTEAIRLFDGHLCNLNWHNERLMRSRRELFELEDSIDIAQHIDVPEECMNGLFKVRVVYSEKVESVRIEPYKIKVLQSCKLVHADSIDYRYKYRDRRCIEELINLNPGYDDIIIAVNGQICDASSSNLVFEINGELVMPKTAMLRGSTMSRLLYEKKVREEKIYIEDMQRFTRVHFVNAMVALNERCIPVDSIV
ncbi:MAG: aminotransferase class IV [Candidatus Latescibacteria bacterium]|nr:aminotransferase class IV [Candidatus Latescibacterota bacterium]